MGCKHKFSDYLNLEKLDFEPEILVVGTFNPAWPENNQAEWFYGRTHDADGNINNNFWDILPRLHQKDTLIKANKKAWQEFCKENKIAITDLITEIKDAENTNAEHIKHLRGYSDKAIAEKFGEFHFTDIVAILKNHPRIHTVYLTRGISETFWKRLWKPVQQHMQANGKTVKTLLTPSGYAFYQQGRHNKLYPDNKLALNDFILLKWKEDWVINI